MRARTAFFTYFAIAFALLLAGGIARIETASAAAASGKAAAAGKDVSTNDDFQRSAHAHKFPPIANRGPSRGENIYFYKCWMCHNKYAKGGPYLKSLYQHESLMSGDPVTDQNVIAKIKEGGPGMPAF